MSALGSIPRYVRINRLKTSLEDVIQDFKQSGYQLVEPQNIASFVTQVNIVLDMIVSIWNRVGQQWLMWLLPPSKSLENVTWYQTAVLFRMFTCTRSSIATLTLNWRKSEKINLLRYNVEKRQWRMVKDMSEKINTDYKWQHWKIYPVRVWYTGHQGTVPCTPIETIIF